MPKVIGQKEDFEAEFRSESWKIYIFHFFDFSSKSDFQSTLKPHNVSYRSDQSIYRPETLASGQKFIQESIKHIDEPKL